MGVDFLNTHTYTHTQDMTSHICGTCLRFPVTDVGPINEQWTAAYNDDMLYNVGPTWKK